MLTVEISLPEIEELKGLVQEGQEKGYLTYDEVAAALEEIELTKEQLEDFYTYLIEHNIELLDAESKQTAQLDAQLHGENVFGERRQADRHRRERECLGDALESGRDPIGQDEQGGAA